MRCAVSSGRLNPRQAQVVLDELAGVDPVIADRILDELLDTAGGPVVLRPERLRRWLNRRTLAADPDGAKKKRVLAEREETGVRYRALPNGLAQKVTTGPAVDIQKAMRQLDAMTPPVSPEDGRTRGQLLCDTELGAIGFTADHLGMGPVPLEFELEVPVKSGAYGLTPVSRLPEPVVIRTDLAGLADIVAGTPLDGMFRPDAAEAAVTPEPTVVATPLVPRQRSAAVQTLADLVARDARHTGNRKGGSPELRLELLIARRGKQIIEITGHHDDTEGPTGGTPAPAPTDPDAGGPHGRATARPSVATTRLSPPATPSTTDPAPTGYVLPPASVPTLAGHGPIDPDLVRRYLTSTDTKVRRLFVDPVTGVCAVDPTPVALNDVGTAAIPMPPPATVAYQPTAAQRRVAIARYQQCSFPGCGGRARKADLDHAVAFDDGGETTVANLHPLCRFHHQVKQRGWSVTRTPDGASLWTSPTGKQYRSTPGEQ